MARTHPRRNGVLEHVRGLFLLLWLACAVACNQADQSSGPLSVPAPGPLEPPPFLELAEASGLDFRHFNGKTGEYYFCEIVGPGGAMFDYDNDGDLDIYLVQGQQITADGKPPAESPYRDRLFRNDLSQGADGKPVLTFTDVTDQSGIRALGYGMGVAAGDYDNDGWVDLYLTNFGHNQFWRNNGDGTFRDVTAETGTDDARWSTSASFFDFDRDGYLDLFLTNYVAFSLANHRPCGSDIGRPDYCGPQTYPDQPDSFFRNRGDGTFQDISAPSGILSSFGPGLGVVTADFNGDGWMDVYVANDQDPNLLWINQKDGTFRDNALLAGCAVNIEGLVEASMGIDAGDIDNDGDDDLFMTHLNGETNTLYLNDGTGAFQDATVVSRLGSDSLAYTGWGTAMMDFDNDSLLDLVVANGAVYSIDALAQQGDPYPFHQPNQLFRNLGGGVFENLSASAGEAFSFSEISRGVAVGDLDNDGDPDVLVCNDDGPVRLLINQVGQDRAWIGFRAVSSNLKRDMTGAKVFVYTRDGRALYRRCRADASYCSANDPRVLFGLGESGGVERVEVLWPDQYRETWPAPEINRYHTLVQGTGQPLEVN